jgi:hypothetical protein
MFAVRYSNFHQLRAKNDLQNAATDLVAMFRDDIAPKSWWAVMLCDAVDLLQHREWKTGRFSFQNQCRAHRSIFTIFIVRSIGVTE